MQAAVVDAVQAALEAVVLAADAGQERTGCVADRHVERVHAVVHALRDQLREHDGRDAVLRRVAEVFLPRRPERGVDDELVGVGVEGRRCADAGDIRAVADLGHRERAGNLQAHDVGEPRVVVRLGPQVQDGGAEQAPLHSALDLQARVGGDQLLEGRDVAAVVALAAEVLRKGAVHMAEVGEHLELAEDARAVLVHGEPLDAVHLGPGRQLAGRGAHVGPGAKELPLQRRQVHGRGGRIVGNLDRAGIDAGLDCGAGSSSGGGGALGGFNHRRSFVFRAELEFLHVRYGSGRGGNRA